MKKSLMITIVVIASIIVTAGIVKAAGFTTDWLRVGTQGTGGVTFFNGTLLNDTTKNGIDSPVTIGDNVRIDGQVWRGATAGSGDDKPFIINDDLWVKGTLSVVTIQELITEEGGAGGAKAASLEETTWKGYSHYSTGVTKQKYHKSAEVTITFTPETETTGTWTATPFNPFNPTVSTTDTDGEYTLVENVIFAGYDDFTYDDEGNVETEFHLVSSSIVDLKGNTMTLYNTSSTPGTITVLTKQ